MAKVRTSAKQKELPSDLPDFKYTGALKDADGIVESIAICLKEGDLEAIQDLLIAHLNAVNKTKLVKDTGLGRQTIYDLINKDKPFNPSMETFVRLTRGLSRYGKEPRRSLGRFNEPPSPRTIAKKARR